jgi:hypothetical protein
MKTKVSASRMRRTGLGLARAIAFMSLTAICQLSAQTVPATPPSQLLEKGIYSEETKGDLDGAMKLYEQIISEGKDAQGVAAQAEYRLGVCYYKKNNFTKANESFEKLVHDFPDQTNLVARAQDYLAGAVSLLPAPWADGEQLLFDVKFPSGFKLGTGSYSARLGETNGQKIWHLKTDIYAGMRQASHCDVVADSFKPIYCEWKHTLIGDAETTYTPGGAEVVMKGKPGVKKVTLTGIVYDNEEAVQLFRRLPLTTNYSTTLRVLTGLGGGGIIPFKAEVASIEKVTVPAGTFECYKVELSIKQTFWYSTDGHRYLVKFEAGGIVAELSKINILKNGEVVKFTDPTSEVVVTAPEGWVFDYHEADDAASSTRTVLLDPEARAMAMMTSQKITDLKADAQKSLRAFGEAQLAEGAKTVKDLKMHEDSWTDLRIAGQPATSVEYDFVLGGEHQIGHAAFTFVNGYAMEFAVFAPDSDFKSVLNAFQSIIDSAKTK